MVRQLVKRVVFPVLKPIADWYFSSARWYSYNGVKVRVNPGVFFPHLTISTKVFLGYLDKQNLKELSVLELGAGCGIMSFYCSKMGANVTASDVSELAIENLRQNQQRKQLDVEVVHSDLFDSLSGQFDRVLINPPYYPKNPTTEAEKAWFCGAEFDYFKKLGYQLKSGLAHDGYALMILSEDCEIETIKTILGMHEIEMKEVLSTKRLGEKNYIYQLA